jgi:hypothetical protein
MQLFGKAPYVASFSATALEREIEASSSDEAKRNPGLLHCIRETLRHGAV